MELIKNIFLKLTGKKEKKEHWNQIFKKISCENLGWYESDLEQTFKYINKLDKLQEKTIFISGAGTSLLVDELIGKCKHLILNDISQEALDIVKKRIVDSNQKITWLIADISKPLLIEDASIDLWIDRAVLHFLTEEEQINSYFSNLDKKIKKNAHVLIAEFSKDGANKCAGLKVHKYSLEEIAERCDNKFKLLEHEYYNYKNPQGEIKPYIYCFLKKI